MCPAGVVVLGYNHAEKEEHELPTSISPAMNNAACYSKEAKSGLQAGSTREYEEEVEGTSEFEGNCPQMDVIG